MVKKYALLLFFWGFILNLSAQVGVNTTDPKAQLDVASTNESTPEVTDGILIPRISNFPLATPTIDQHGMMVFLNKSLPGYAEGFYYWNQTSGSWRPVAGTAFSDFYKVGTQQYSQNIHESIFRIGNMSLGAESDFVKLKVTVSPQETHSTKAALEVENLSSAPKNVTYGIVSTNRSITSDKKYGIKNYVSAEGEGIHYGIFNETFQKTNEEIYGIYNSVGKTFGSTKSHYGIYSTIGTVQGNGIVYGIYSAANGNIAKNVFAGYFAGRLGVGYTPAEEYVFPGARGEQGQVLVLGTSGEVTWKYPATQNYTSTTSAVGNYVIPDDVYTLRINNSLSSVTIPDANSNKGRIIVLVGWPGTSQKNLLFLTGNDLLDIRTNTAVTSISGGEVLTIQSTGVSGRWIVIGR